MPEVSFQEDTITNFLSNDPIRGEQGLGLNRGPLTRSTTRRYITNANFIPINPAGRGTTLFHPEHQFLVQGMDIFNDQLGS